ncbi:ImmA/IrrE family metallo-endopeptidase [Candidatus Saccharibacteria bacterium]|nr:ImmA/IrrE family metallo-endopeptidase [Candidatus Saccharibacteria bacterium]
MDEAIQLTDDAKFTEARHKAAALLKAAKVKQAPVTLNSIYQLIKSEFGAVIVPADESVVGKERDAMLINRDGQLIILYNKNRPVVRQRFSVAHEIGHLYFGHVMGNSSLKHGYKSFDEQEADHFAAHLLMPTAFLRKDIKAGMKDVEELAKKYGVSKDALWIQITNGGLINLF